MGALNLFGRVPTTLTAAETRLLRALADIATTALLSWVREPLGVADIVTRTQAALSAKAVVDTACGMLAATAPLPPHEAELHLRAYAARRRLRATDVAARLVRREILPEDVLAQAFGGEQRTRGRSPAPSRNGSGYASCGGRARRDAGCHHVVTECDPRRSHEGRGRTPHRAPTQQPAADTDEAGRTDPPHPGGWAARVGSSRNEGRCRTCG